MKPENNSSALPRASAKRALARPEHTSGSFGNRDIAEISTHLVAPAQPVRPRAFCRGDAQTMRATAAALRARERGEQAALPPGVIADPTLEHVVAACRELRIEPPKTIPKGGWSSPIFMMARKSPPHFTDPQKEAAIAGVIAAGTFDDIPVEALCAPEAFADPRWRLVFDVACVLRTGNHRKPVCLESVNDHIAFHGRDKEFQHDLDSTRTVPWQRWPELADSSLAYSQRGAAYSLAELARLYRERQAAEIGEQLQAKAISIDEALKELEALANGANGAFDFALAKERRFNAAKLHDKPEPTVILDDKPICTAGNISVIYAKPKAGKSAAVSAIIGAAISDDPFGDYLGFSCRENADGHALIHIDTEQSRYDHEQLVLLALRRSERKELPPWVRSYCITDFSTAQRRAFLAAEIEHAARECKGVFAVLVDGVGDFVSNVNDPEETHGFVLELHALAIRYETHLLLVLHENPNEESQKTRGHLGSQLERKSESNIRITKDAEGICSLYTERSRHTHIPKSRAHCFRWDNEKEMHCSCTVELPAKDEGDLVEALFECEAARKQAGGLQWAELLNRFVELKLYKTPNSARRRFKQLLDGGWLKKQGEHYWGSCP